MFDFRIYNKPQIAHKEVLCDSLSPLSVLFALKAKVLLESAYNETGKDRYSLVILNEAFRVYKEEGIHYLVVKGAKTPLHQALQGYLTSENIKKSLGIRADSVGFAESRESKGADSKQGFLENLAIVRSLAPKPNAEQSPHLPLDLPLPLGGAGYIGYEFFAEIENVEFSNPPLYNAPECGFIFGRDFLIFDHLFDRLHIVSVSYAYEKEAIDVAGRVASIAKKLESLNVASSSLESTPDSQAQGYEIQNATSQKEYETMVEKIKDSIYKGDLLQCVPSQSMQVKSPIPPLQAYRNLRHQNPSPYMFYYDFDDFVILGASPEIMIRLKTSDEISHFILRPIAGTRPRGKSVAQDLELEKELLNDEKENAEHLMLLDLARNDAGKVSVGGGVSVIARNKIERYSRVMHIVSSVQGELDSKRFAKRDALKAAFPAGTLSGAPKIAAIEMIESLESTRRGVYGGAIGYFTQNEDMDFAIAIRSAVYQNGVYYMRSGAGVVQDSNPRAEYLETQNKIQSLLDMLRGQNEVEQGKVKQNNGGRNKKGLKEGAE
ncbi:anthranilate synthase component I family protein [Helicobacter cinaedi]|uniref:anthranilate synthase component I family protein n=1 Tax=Helicobacter cinaedi TaxID=213 RepID=UPI000CF1AFED|nr:anthranilate synthase component I family protein [Helicobacter cinaedi]